MEDHIAYMERQNKLNSDLNIKEVLDSIDRPIRPLVIEFNRIGLKTKFSCCGFNYDGEEEPKTHTRHAYIFFYEPDTEIGKKNFAYIKKYGEFMQWKFWKHCINKGNGKTEWNISSHLLPNHDTLYVKNDKISTAIHDYEIHVIRIAEMTNFCKNLQSDMEEVEIEDGNKIQVAMYPEWQIKPKKNTILCMKNPWNKQNELMLDTLMDNIDKGKRVKVDWVDGQVKVIEGF